MRHLVVNAGNILQLLLGGQVKVNNPRPRHNSVRCLVILVQTILIICVHLLSPVFATVHGPVANMG